MLVEAVRQAEAGLMDADFGGGLIRQRTARPGGSKWRRYRSIVIFRSGDRAVFVLGFAKSAQSNIGRADLAILKRAADETLEWSNEQLDALVAAGVLLEIGHDEKP
jgi:hypothetical protein